MTARHSTAQYSTIPRERDRGDSRKAESVDVDWGWVEGVYKSVGSGGKKRGAETELSSVLIMWCL